MQLPGESDGVGLLVGADLGPRLRKREYKKRLPELQQQLFELQRACWTARVPTVVVFEGWQASGKGKAIGTLTARLEPRGFKLYAIQQPRTHQLMMPWLHRYWEKLPRYGQMAIFDRSWYFQLVIDRVEKGLTPYDWDRRLEDIRAFERTLADDGHVLIKLFLHISGDEQRRRFEKLEADPLEAWRVRPLDWTRNLRRGELRSAIEEAMAATDEAYAPWTVVSATDGRWARARIFETVIERLEAALTERGVLLPEAGRP